MTSTKRITSSMLVSRTNTVALASGGTSRSNTKLSPVRLEMSSNTVRIGVSRNSIVMGLLSAAVSFGAAFAALAFFSSTLRTIERASLCEGFSARIAFAFAYAFSVSPFFHAFCASTTRPALSRSF